MTTGTFTANFTRFAKSTREQMDAIMRVMVIDLFSSIVKDTPVDTGRARANWVPALNSQPVSGDRAPGSDVNIAGEVGKMTVRDTAYLLNSVPYILRLEYGYSAQAPKGMVRRNLRRLQSFKPGRA